MRSRHLENLDKEDAQTLGVFLRDEPRRTCWMYRPLIANCLTVVAPHRCAV